MEINAHFLSSKNFFFFVTKNLCQTIKPAMWHHPHHPNPHQHPKHDDSNRIKSNHRVTIVILTSISRNDNDNDNKIQFIGTETTLRRLQQ